MYVFVYGTLKQGFENNHLLAESEFIGNGITKCMYPMVAIVKAYPYLIDDENHGKFVKGEVYKIDKNTLNKLDRLEGYPEHYNRRNITVNINHQEFETITYFINKNIDYSELELLDFFKKDEFYYFE